MRDRLAICVRITQLDLVCVSVCVAAVQSHPHDRSSSETMLLPPGRENARGAARI